MLSGFDVATLDRTVKFLDGLNKLATEYRIGLTSADDIHLVVDALPTPFYLYPCDDDGLSVGVSL